jgi:hypothetical protein
MLQVVQVESLDQGIVIYEMICMAHIHANTKQL